MLDVHTNLNRRRLLLGLASASAAGAAVIASGAVIGDTAVDAPEEGALLALGDALAPAAAKMKAANRTYWQVVREWAPKWPLAPDALVSPYYDSGIEERGLLGGTILPDGSPWKWVEPAQRTAADRARCITPAHRLEWQLGQVERTLNRKRSKHPLPADRLMQLEAERATLTDLLAIAEAYEAERARVLEASGYSDANAARRSAGDALEALIGKVMAERPCTMTGVLIQAEALEAYGLVPYHQARPEGWAWPQTIAANLLRIAREAPPEQV